MIDIVLDTNVLVSAFRSKLGASYALLQLLECGAWRPVISPAIALEYEAVLKREMIASAITREDIDDFLDFLLGKALLVQIYFRWRPALPDPNDDCILEVAIRSHAAIVTFNLVHFAGAERFGVKVIGPKDFLNLARGNQ